MSFTNYAARAVLNSVFGKTSNFGALASAPTIYVALYTAAPGEDGTGGTEVSGGAYARQETAASDWNAATDADPSVVTNANAIEFPEATADWGTVTHFALVDASSSGNILAVAALTTSRTVNSGDTASFASDALSISAD